MEVWGAQLGSLRFRKHCRRSIALRALGRGLGRTEEEVLVSETHAQLEDRGGRHLTWGREVPSAESEV